MTVCSMLTDARKQVGITQEQMAERLGVCRITVHNWETNPTKISIDKVKRYYEALPELEDEEARSFFSAMTHH